MKVKILTSYPKQSLNVDRVWFSSDLHIEHKAVIDFGRKFDSVEHMNDHIISEINRLVGENDMLVLLGDSMMGEKDYASLLCSIKCKNVIILYGNHCNIGKLLKIKEDGQLDNLIYQGYYLELNIDGQYVCCSHYPMFNFNHMDDGSFGLHGHLHADENHIVKEIHKYKSMDVGLDSYYKLFGEYSLFSFEQIQELLKDKLKMGRHEN